MKIYERMVVLQEITVEFGECVVLGGAVFITLRKSGAQRVRFEIEAPRAIVIYREEKPHSPDDYATPKPSAIKIRPSQE